MALQFDYDTHLLAQILTAVSECLAESELSVQFTAADQIAVSNALLTDAAANTHAKAETLAAASGVGLGKLLSIDCNWNDKPVYSGAVYNASAKVAMEEAAMDLSPSDISLSDSATFVWEIKDIG